MSTAAYLAIIAIILCILFRILNVNSTAKKCQIVCKDLDFLFTIRKVATLIDEPYIPTRLWGFSGHVQTILHSIIGRVRCPWPISERVWLRLNDGSTVTYDLYQPINTSFEDDITIAICPGIGNTSESVYIRTFVHFAQCHGYRCAVLNHVGALKCIPITSSRIFNYGETNDYNEMIKSVQEKHPDTKIVCIGFSLGGNIVTKYLGEKRLNRSQRIIGAVSICQGYCASGGMRYLLSWQNFRRFYLYIMTESMKSIILTHRSILLSEDVTKRYNINERQIIMAKTLYDLDESYTRKVNNFSSVNELYKWSSCIHYFNDINTPMIFINAKDDPIVPEELLEPIRHLAETKDKVVYLEFAHGGHLGFFEGGLIYPNPITFLDRTLVALVGGLVLRNHETSKFSCRK